MNIPALIATTLIMLFLSVTVVQVRTEESKAKASAIRAGATPTQLICAFNPPEYATSKKKLCGTQESK